VVPRSAAAANPRESRNIIQRASFVDAAFRQADQALHVIVVNAQVLGSTLEQITEMRLKDLRVGHIIALTFVVALDIQGDSPLFLHGDGGNDCS
jgi:hypothetical protein